MSVTIYSLCVAPLQATPSLARPPSLPGLACGAIVASFPTPPVTLGEGWTPMLPSRRHPYALLKEEGTNPTSSFKAQALALAVTMARHYGLRQLAIPSAGNASRALVAHAAAAAITAHIFMPRDLPFANYVEAIAYGANVTLVDGLISDCGRIVAEPANPKDGSTFPR
jgi:threonine synthase